MLYPCDMGLEIEYRPLGDIQMYEDNAKLHPQFQIEQIKQSIKEFGMLDPIAIWHGVIVEGHGRYIACKELGFETVPVISLDNLTDEQRKAYGLIHNKLTMNTDFDLTSLNKELDKIISLDMSDFGFEKLKLDIDDEPDIDNYDDGYYGDERERTADYYNLREFDAKQASGFYQMPIIEAVDHTPKSLIGFNYVKSASDAMKQSGVHFFIDDYQFERLWNNPYDYITALEEFDCVLTPDFSLYMDMPRAMKIWNVYRSRLLGQLWQNSGLIVIPTLQWAERETFEFCFDGLAGGGTYAVSTVGVMRDKNAQKIWSEGMQYAIDVLNPKRIVCYGTKPEFDFKDIEVIYIDARKWEGNK